MMGRSKQRIVKAKKTFAKKNQSLENNGRYFALNARANSPMDLIRKSVKTAASTLN